MNTRKEGKLRGTHPDLVDLLSKKLGFTFEYRQEVNSLLLLKTEVLRRACIILFLKAGQILESGTLFPFLVTI